MTSNFFLEQDCQADQADVISIQNKYTCFTSFFSLLDVNIGREQLLIPSSFKIARGEINFSLLLEKMFIFAHA